MVRKADPNRELLRKVAVRLGTFNDECLFVGGTTVGILLSDPGAPTPRPTHDVDIVVEAAGLADLVTRVRERLLALGLSESSAPGDPICAWRVDGIRVDVMPTDSTVLGFSNPWYKSAMRSAKVLELDGVRVQVIDAPHFIATKFEAFNGRGKMDYHGSHDLEDIIAVVDGRPELLEEVSRADEELREYLKREFKRLIGSATFLNALDGHVEGEDRGAIVLDRLRLLADVEPHNETDA